MKLFPIIALFALFAAQAFAYDVSIVVTVAQGTLAVGTNISIVKDGTLLYSAKADGSGSASFKLDQGSYFVYLDRGGYSRHINILEVNKNDNITYTMRQLISYASVYGQVSGTSDFNSALVTAYVNGNVAKRATPNKDGYYLMSFMPDGEYMMVFNAQGFVGKNVSITLSQPQFSEVNVKLDRIPVAPEFQPTITVPPVVQKQSVIEILLMKGSSPISGQVVFVKTPSGSVEVTTGIDGKAHVNAVKPGEYIFTYGNLTSKTIVEGAENATVQPPVVTPEPVVPIATTQPQKPADTGLVAGAAIVVMSGAVVALGIILFVASRMIKKQKPKAEAKSHEPAASTPHAEHAASHKHAHFEGHDAHQHAKHDAVHKHEHEASQHAPAHEHKHKK